MNTIYVATQTFNLNPINAIIISGMLQLLILALLLFFSKKGNQQANKFFAGLIMIIAAQIFWVMAIDFRLYQAWESVLHIPCHYSLALGPLFFFYTKSLTTPNFRLNKKLARHLLPVTIELGLNVCLIWVSMKQNKLVYDTTFFAIFYPLEQLAGVVSVWIYLNRSLKLIDAHENWVFHNFSNTRDFTLQWLKKLLKNYKILWLIILPQTLLFVGYMVSSLEHVAIYILLYLFFLVLVYWTYWMGLQVYQQAAAIGALSFYKDQMHKVKPAHKNYASLEEERIQNHLTTLKKLMEDDKLYLDQTLNLRKLATHLKTDANTLSYLLNSHLGQRFYEYINQYRVKEVKEKLRDPAYQHYTILSLAFDAGFSSKATFNRIFKEFAKVSPKAYRDQLN